MIDKIYKLGIDVGNKLVKIFGDQQLEPIIYPASLVRYSDISYIFNNNIEYLEVNDFEVFSLEKDKAESCYVWGENLFKLGQSAIDTNGIGKLRYENKLYRKLVLFAIAKYVEGLNLQEQKNKPIISLAMGLPDEEYVGVANSNFEVMSWMIGEHTVYIDNLPIQFEIRNIEVVPQEFGSLILFESIKGGITADVRTMIIDYGGVTRLRDVYDGFQQRNVNQDTLGVQHLINKLAIKLKQEGFNNSRRNHPIGIQKMLISQDYTLKTGLRTEKNFKVLFENEIANYRKNRFEEDLYSGQAFDNIDLLILTGGGANLLDQSQYLQLCSEVWVPEEPETANVRGFYEYLKRKAKQIRENSFVDFENEKQILTLGDKVRISSTATHELNGYDLKPHRNWEGEIIGKYQENERNVFSIEYPTGDRNMYVCENDLVKL